MTDKDLFPVWDDKYNKLGVTPRELYMRQQGLCYLIPEVDGDKVIGGVWTSLSKPYRWEG